MQHAQNKNVADQMLAKSIIMYFNLDAKELDNELMKVGDLAIIAAEAFSKYSPSIIKEPSREE